MKICTIDGCEKKHQAKGYCKRHYERFRLNGDPHRIKKNPWSKFENIFEEFESHVIKHPEKECWGWSGTKDNQGYGYFSYGNKQYKNSRFSYVYYIGPIPAGMFCCHQCDNPECCRPDHLFLGTPKENTQDCKRKGRLNTTQPIDRAVGEKHGMAKLTCNKITEIRKLVIAGLDDTAISLMFNVYPSTIRRVRIKQTWKHLK